MPLMLMPFYPLLWLIFRLDDLRKDRPLVLWSLVLVLHGFLAVTALTGHALRACTAEGRTAVALVIAAVAVVLTIRVAWRYVEVRPLLLRQAWHVRAGDYFITQHLQGLLIAMGWMGFFALCDGFALLCGR